jgi:hypothetical protein
MVLVVDLRAEPDRSELAVLGRKLHLGLSLDELLGAPPVGDQILHRAELEPVLRTELDEIGDAGHRAVVLHDLADHACRREAGKTGEVDRALGLARALERPTGTGAQGEDVARLHDVARAHAGVGGHLDRPCAVARRDAGLDALSRLDRDGERRLVGRLVVRDHEPEPQLVAALGRERQADQPAPVRRHEVDRLGRDELGRHAEVALVLTVGGIAHHYHLTAANGLDGLVDRDERRARRGRVRGFQEGSQSGVPWSDGTSGFSAEAGAPRTWRSRRPRD